MVISTNLSSTTSNSASVVVSLSSLLFKQLFFLFQVLNPETKPAKITCRFKMYSQTSSKILRLYPLTHPEGHASRLMPYTILKQQRIECHKNLHAQVYYEFSKPKNMKAIMNFKCSVKRVWNKLENWNLTFVVP